MVMIMNKHSKFFVFTLPPILWALVIFLESSIPGHELPLLPKILGLDKIIHAAIYFIFCALSYRALKYSDNPFFVKTAFAGALILSILYGASDEFHQLFTVNRSADIFDLLADTAGAAIFLSIVRLSNNNSRLRTVLERLTF
jgi:VanZ family protein